eukprot:6826731-Alexandrium_andersonii.AAC.1
MRSDAELGRTTPPRPLTDATADSSLLARRFSRGQGWKADGSLELRAAGDETRTGANRARRPGEKLRNSTVD